MSQYRTLDCGCVQLDGEKITRHCLEHAPISEEIKAILKRTDCGPAEIEALRSALSNDPRLVNLEAFGVWLRANKEAVNDWSATKPQPPAYDWSQHREPTKNCPYCDCLMPYYSEHCGKMACNEQWMKEHAET